MNIISQLESILFVASKPVTEIKLAKALRANLGEAQAALADLKARYGAERGVVLYQNNDEWQLVTNPANKTATEQFVKAEVSGDLTRPQLEALTVIAYRGPITRPELEQIRGVNCSLILRNLMLRGLVQERAEATALLPMYEVTMEYLRHIGVANLAELPDYATLHAHEYVTRAVAEMLES